MPHTVKGLARKFRSTYKFAMKQTPEIICLFSGGLDSLLAALLLQRQGLTVRCVHFVSPFFGNPQGVEHWCAAYGLDIVCHDLGETFAAMLYQRPEHGFGKTLNPCVDCKILQLRTARAYMQALGAQALATGEVLGQRPMSQRRDTLNLIQREAAVRDILLRPLSALHLEPTGVERDGLVDRTRLLGIQGRGRKEQLALARDLGLTHIPTPSGGCRLTERENARRYWAVLTHVQQPAAADFDLANLGRQCWHETAQAAYWLCVGRHSADNEKLAAAARPGDALLMLRDVPGPLALARQGFHWPEDVLRLAAAHMASSAPKAVGRVVVRCTQDGTVFLDLSVTPQRSEQTWGELSWESVKAQLRAEARERQMSK